MSSIKRKAPVVILDVYDTLIDITPGLVKFLKKKLKRDIDAKNMSSAHISSCSDLNDMQFGELVDEYADTDWILKSKPVPGALDGLKELQRMGFQLYYRVRPDLYLNDQFWQWLASKYIDIIELSDGSIGAWHSNLITGNVYISTDPEELNKFKNANPRKICMCFGSAYNTEWDGIRVSDWTSLLHTLRTYSRLPEFFKMEGE